MVVYKSAAFDGDAAAAWGLVEAYPFATLLAGGADLAAADGLPSLAHLPLLVERDAKGAPVALVGHIARRNKLWQRFIPASSSSSLAIFQGPDGYVTPTWYGTYDVPTWNYAVVHVRARVELIEREDKLIDMLKDLTARFEGADGWKFGRPDDLAASGSLAAAIVGLRLVVTGIDAKFKLGQNRSAADQQGVMAGLEQRASDGKRGDRAMAALMRDRLKAKASELP